MLEAVVVFKAKYNENTQKILVQSGKTTANPWPPLLAPLFAPKTKSGATSGGHKVAPLLATFAKVAKSGAKWLTVDGYPPSLKGVASTHQGGGHPLNGGDCHP